MTWELEPVIERRREQLQAGPSTLGELIEIAQAEGLPLSRVVVAEASLLEGKPPETVLEQCLEAFDHNLKALEIGLSWGESFLLGTVGADLAALEGPGVAEDPFLDRAVRYTLATEVGNHEVGLQPCAGTGDSCPYTGLLKALMEEGASRERLGLTAALLLKVGRIFRAGKRTTGCNMEGYGAGAAATAAALTDLRGGSPEQVGKAVVLALSPTIAVPCTPRVMVKGLCAAHIAGAVLMGNLAANLILKTTLPVEVEVDVMLAMAAKIHVEAAPVITGINLEYMKPFFSLKPRVEAWVDPELRGQERERTEGVQDRARQELRSLLSSGRPLTQTLGEVVVGGSSIAVGSPTNMARVAHALVRGNILEVRIDLTVDLFSRRAINVPAMLMAALHGAATDDAQAYKRILEHPDLDRVRVSVNKLEEPEVQRVWIRASERSAFVDGRNRGGGRLAIVQAEPSLEAAREAAERLHIQVVE